MQDGKQAGKSRQEQQTAPYDLSEESSKRPEGEAATTAARQAESDDIYEHTVHGPVDTPDDDFFGANKLATSLDDE